MGLATSHRPTVLSRDTSVVLRRIGYPPDAAARCRLLRREERLNRAPGSFLLGHLGLTPSQGTCSVKAGGPKRGSDRVLARALGLGSKTKVEALVSAPLCMTETAPTVSRSKPTVLITAKTVIPSTKPSLSTDRLV